jgi:hypothetical protein
LLQAFLIFRYSALPAGNFCCKSFKQGRFSPQAQRIKHAGNLIQRECGQITGFRIMCDNMPVYTFYSVSASSQKKKLCKQSMPWIVRVTPGIIGR